MEQEINGKVEKIDVPLGQIYEIITSNWNGFSSVYQSMQAGPLTFYYTLVNMMKLSQAKNILQIGCGTGKLIPMILDIKDRDTLYYATDISEKMIKLGKQGLQKHFNKYKSSLSFQQWLKFQNLNFKVANGQEPIILKQMKLFDRIICNCVLMHTTDPRKMLKNLFDSAADNCLLGLSVWGQKNDNPFFASMQQISLKYKFISLDSRSKFFLCDTIETLVKQQGWQIILSWQQNSMIPVLQHSQENPHRFLKQQIMEGVPKQYYQDYSQVINQLMNNKKCGLSFGCRLIIAKKIIKD